jgi:hypothetical protein
MTASKDHAGRATAALADLLRPGADLGAVAGIIQQAMDDASKTSADQGQGLCRTAPLLQGSRPLR